MKRIIFFLVVFIFAGVAAAQMQGHGMGKMGKAGKAGCDNFERGAHFGRAHRPGNILRHSEALELTDGQIDKIKSIRLSHHEAMIDLRADLKKLELHLHNEMHSDSPDKNRALSINSDIAELKGRVSEMKMNHRFDIREILTVEQVKKLDKLKTKCPPMGRGKGGHGIRHQDGCCGR
ncbi:MAG: Spy/CpxP family protein refolding chaperone [candidate division Zixibacteria bacterium]